MSASWPKVKLGQVLKRIERFEPRHELTEYQFAGTYSFAHGIFVGERKLGSTFALPKVQRIHAGDFVYCKIMAWEGAFGLVPAEANGCVMSGAFVVYEINQDRLDQNFLKYFFKIPANWGSIGSQSTGTNIRRRSLHPNQFEVAQMPLPPLAEQRRIVARIEELAAKIAEARSLRHQAAQEAGVLTSSQLSQVFDSAPQSGLPQGWGWKSLNDFLSGDGAGITTGPFGTLLQKSDIQKYGVPVLGISNVQANRFVAGFSDYVTESKATILKAYSLQPGDVVIARSGTVGRSCVVPPGMDPAPIMSTNLIRLRLNPKVFMPALLCRLLNGSRIVEAHKNTECRGSSRTFFTQKILLKLRIPTPPVDDQERIMIAIEALQAQVNALKKFQTETAAELDALLPSILDKAFKGEL